MLVLQLIIFTISIYNILKSHHKSRKFYIKYAIITNKKNFYNHNTGKVRDNLMFEQDYIMRIIKDLGRALAKIFLNKDTVAYELPDEENYTQTDLLHIKLLELIKQGNINEAENLLFEELDTKNKRYIELALDFYNRLSNLDDDFLEKNNFTKEEIEQGLKAIAKELGVLI